ncbi:hypothetical protein [Legionella cardiaca]|uniref:Uncharacterized protein n=1 Tax=Legionella cardiaca TaxID=1071983 RepID=A0ABY8APE0_9GAMM|nr:hypothetical protein [Legionella cardiaca]WED42574.1 hypothetical protein PXX05_11735 [Legionella cardiaca]
MSIGPFWSQELNGWLRFVIEGNKFVPQIALVSAIDTKLEDWVALEKPEGTWTVYYVEGEEDSNPTTFSLQNDTLYKTTGDVGKYTGLIAHKKTAIQDSWYPQNVNQFNPFPDYKKSSVIPTPLDKLPLPPEMHQAKGEKSDVKETTTAKHSGGEGEQATVDKSTTQKQVSPDKYVIGPFWSNDLDGWIQFVGEENKPPVAQVSLRDGVSKTTTAWHTLDGEEGPWTVYYDGTDKPEATTFTLKNNNLYRTEGRESFGVIWIDQLNLATKNWQRHHQEKEKFDPFPGYKKSDAIPVPYAELPLTPEKRQELIEREKAQRQELIEKEQAKWQEFRKTSNAVENQVGKQVGEKQPLFASELVEALKRLNPEYENYATSAELDKATIQDDLNNELQQVLNELWDSSQTGREFLNHLKVLVEKPVDENKLIAAASKTFFQLNDSFPKGQEVVTRILEQAKRDYFLAFVKELGNAVAKKFDIVDIDFDSLTLPRVKIPEQQQTSQSRQDTHVLDELTEEEQLALALEESFNEWGEVGFTADELTQDELLAMHANRGSTTFDSYEEEFLGEDEPIDKQAHDVAEDSNQKLLKEIVAAVNQAQENYANWYNKGQRDNTRGSNGFFTWARHWASGQKNASDLRQAVKDINEYETISALKLDLCVNSVNEFLTKEKTGYHAHSFSSFLLDKLTKIENSPWSKLELHGRHYNKADVIEIAKAYQPVSDENSSQTQYN